MQKLFVGQYLSGNDGIKFSVLIYLKRYKNLDQQACD
jgi:hypothetical protein